MKEKHEQQSNRYKIRIISKKVAKRVVFSVWERILQQIMNRVQAVTSLLSGDSCSHAHRVAMRHRSSVEYTESKHPYPTLEYRLVRRGLLWTLPGTVIASCWTAHVAKWLVRWKWYLRTDFLHFVETVKCDSNGSGIRLEIDNRAFAVLCAVTIRQERP